MTVKERMMAVYSGRPCDRMPVAGYARYLLRGSVEREIRALGMGIIDYVPAVSMLPPPWHMLDGYLSQIEGGDIAISFRWEKGKRIERRTLSVGGRTLWADLERDNAGAGSEHRETLETFVKQGAVAGAISMTSDHGKVETAFVGLADPETGRALDEQSFFWIASMTKGFCAAGCEVHLHKR